MTDDYSSLPPRSSKHGFHKQDKRDQPEKPGNQRDRKDAADRNLQLSEDREADARSDGNPATVPDTDFILSEYKPKPLNTENAQEDIRTGESRGMLPSRMSRKHRSGGSAQPRQRAGESNGGHGGGAAGPESSSEGGDNSGGAGGMNPGLAVIVTTLAIFMAVLDTTIVNVSIPKMMNVFGVNTTQIQWVVTAYTLVVGAFVPVTGYLGDRFGYKRTFLMALSLFTIGSALCGLAWNNDVMIFFRIIQALGGGALMPISMAIAFRIFPPERRGFAMGLVGIAIMFAPAFGPTIGGYITEYMDWRLIFYINVPIGIIDFFLATIILKELSHSTKRRFDIAGFIASSLGFSTLLYGLGIVANKGWNDPRVVTFVAIGIVSLISFVVIEFTVKYPMLDIRLMKDSPIFSVTILITSISSIILFATLFLLPVFLQDISGLSPLRTGLVLLPQGIVVGIMMPISGWLFDKIGARWLAVVGLLIAAYGLYLLQSLDVTTSFGTVSAWLMVRAVGLGMVMMPVTTAGMNEVPIEKVGQATAITNTTRQVSASFGVAWLANLLSSRTKFHASILKDQFNVFSHKANESLTYMQHMFMGSGMTAAQAKGTALYLIWGQIQKTATVKGIDDVFWATTWLIIAGVVLGFFLRSGRRKEKQEMPMMGE